jgi:RNA polymerase sigma-70 factor (ECF subfamily)
MDTPAKAMNDWMDAAAGGNPAAFERLAASVQDELYRFSLAQGLQTHDAAEAVQEALMRAWRGRRKWQPGRNARNWLMGFALNCAREQRRRRTTSGPPDWLAALPDGGDPPDAAAARAELLRVLDDLPPRQQEAVACRYLRQMSIRETAEAMGCAEGTVKAAVFAGLQSMRKRLKAKP